LSIPWIGFSARVYRNCTETDHFSGGLRGWNSRQYSLNLCSLPCKQLANGSKKKHFNSNMRHAQVLRALFHKWLVFLIYEEHDTLVWQKRVYNIY
jgi:hypothetical protein